MKGLESVDPNLYSSLPTKLENLCSVGKDRNAEFFIDSVSGDRYYEVVQAPRVQVFVTKLLKGIVSVSDIAVIYDDEQDVHRVFSKEMDLEAGELNKNSSDVNSDQYVLSLVFKDFDHSSKKMCAELVKIP